MTTTGLFITDLPEGVTGHAVPNPAAPTATSDPTTLAVGEEGGDGEDGEDGKDDDAPTTLAVGEEGGDGDDAPTTLAVGEEGEEDGDRD